MRIKTTLIAAMLLLIAVPGNASADDVDQRRMKWDKTIKAAKDFDTLKLMCADEIIRTPPGRSRHEACKVLHSGVVSLLNTKTTCKTIIKTWKTLHKKYLKGASKSPGHLDVSKKLAKCGEWDYLWEEHFHWGGGRKGAGVLLLHALDAQKIDVEKEFFAYVKRAGKRALTVDHAKFTIINYTRWLKESKRTNDCGKYVKVAGQTSPAEVSGGKDVGGAWHWFFNETNCKAAADFTTTRLTNERAPNRTAACSTLGRIGSSEKHIAKMQIIVDTDPAYKEEVRDGSKVKVYYVRDACKAGIGKIKLRMP